MERNTGLDYVTFTLLWTIVSGSGSLRRDTILALGFRGLWFSELGKNARVLLLISRGMWQRSFAITTGQDEKSEAGARAWVRLAAGNVCIHQDPTLQRFQSILKQPH